MIYRFAKIGFPRAVMYQKRGQHRMTLKAHQQCSQIERDCFEGLHRHAANFDVSLKTLARQSERSPYPAPK